MTRFVALLVAASAILLAACRNNANNVVLADLSRSEKIQTLCGDVEDLTGNRSVLRDLLPTVVCTEETSFGKRPDEGGEPQGDIDARFFGVVTQVETGEVATIDFTRSRIANTNVTVPGVTPVTVGEQPTAIQTSPFDATYSYVTSFSPKSLQAISSVELLTGDIDFDPETGVALFRQELRFDAGPKDVGLHESAYACLVRDEDDEQRPVVGASSAFDYRYLYVALPDLGQIAQVPFNVDASGAQSFGDPTFLQLDTYDCDTVMQGDPPPVSDESDYNRICPQNAPDLMREGRYIKEVRTTTPCAEGGAVGPRPVAVTIDLGAEQGVAFPVDGAVDPEDEDFIDDPDNACDELGQDRIHTGSDADDVLLVADANQPVIHRFQIDENGATPLDPIITGTPTSHLDVTPVVPASSEPSDRAATQRYVYAVSAMDGSVLAVEYTPDDPSFGEVLPVIPGISARANEENIESRNRVRFAFSNVRDIEVVTPSYALVPDGDGLQVPADAICTPENRDSFSSVTTAGNMRGVFLAVSLSNGTMFFLDVYDLNAPCRGGDTAQACTVAETGADQFASIRRHRRRFSFTPSTYVDVDGVPALQFNSASGRIDESNGDAMASDGPGLDFIECPRSMLLPTDPNRAAFGPRPGGDGIGLICISSQVWSSFSQRWDARWQGLIPASEGGLGLFADTNLEGDETGNWFQAGDVPFCRVGVLGPQNGSDPNVGSLNSYPGDRLVITGDLPPETRDAAQCSDFVDLKDDIDDRQIWFPILEAYDDQLRIGSEPAGARYTLEQVRSCYTQFTEYQVHTRNAYAVTGTQTGFVHRVVPDPDNDDECVLDATRPVVPDDVDTFLTGRAFPGEQYINPLVSFQIGEFPEGTNPTDSTVARLSFNISNLFTSLVLDSSNGFRSLPASMLYTSEQEGLLFVDYESGVSVIGFSPLNIGATFD